MSDDSEISCIQQLARRIRPDSTLLRAWPLEGGVSAQVSAFEIVHPDGRTERMVLRQHGVADRERNPNIAAEEFRLLKMLDTAGLAVPQPLHVVRTGEIFPTPSIVVEYIDGSTEVSTSEEVDAIDQMATYLANLHAVDWSRHDLSFLPDLDERIDRMLNDAPGDNVRSDVAQIRNALAAHWPLSRTNDPVLLHGDFWHGNVLRKDGQIAAVIDWEDAAVGDPLADVAKNRLEIAFFFGLDLMAAFTARYTALNPVAIHNLPFWELYAALGPTEKLSTWGLDPGVEVGMRAVLEERVDRALAALRSRLM